jgi:hypothetical protein
LGILLTDRSEIASTRCLKIDSFTNLHIMQIQTNGKDAFN